MPDLRDPESTLKDIDALTEAEKDEEIRFWRSAWSWTPESVRYYVLRHTHLLRVTTRTNKAYLGTLAGTAFSLDHLDIDTVEVDRNYETGRSYEETKTLRIPISTITYMEFIEEREEREEEREERDLTIADLVGSEAEQL